MWYFLYPPSWRTTPCRLSATAYSIYLQLPSILEAIPPSAPWGRTTMWWQGPNYHGYTLLPATKKGWKHSCKPFCESLFSSSITFLMMLVAPQKCHPFNADCNWGNK
jgi:hypothetical protein